MPAKKWGVPHFLEGVPHHPPHYVHLCISACFQFPVCDGSMMCYDIGEVGMEVGGKKVLMSQVIFVPDNETANFVVDVEGADELPVRFEFITETCDESTPEEKRPEARFRVAYDAPEGTTKIDCLVLRFFNFDRSLGQSITEPVSVAISNDKDIVLFCASVQRLVNMRKVEFQFMLKRVEA
ncbi:DUF6864 domain-containing function [Pseudomonas sp. 22082]|uniref:DUF6864 domain-containing function n=1 Tax=Pseudomonas sp. 22082 TaxID=3453868 RepID=UPI003F85FC4C